MAGHDCRKESVTKHQYRGWQVWILGRGPGGFFYDLADPMICSAPLPGSMSGPFEDEAQATVAAKVEIDGRCGREAEAVLSVTTSGKRRRVRQ